jgi:hypothetical protein
MFHLKCNTNYNTVCKLWWHQRKRIIELFYFLVFICKEELTGQFYWRCLKCLPPSRRQASTRNYVANRWAPVLFNTSLSWCHDVMMFHEEHQTTSFRSNVREGTRVPLVNTLWLLLHSFCISGLSRGLATKFTLTLMSQWSLLHGVDLILVSLL